MPGVSARFLEKTLARLSNTLEQAEQTHKYALGTAPLQAIDARIKVVGALLLTVAAVSCRRLEPVLGLLVVLTALAMFSQIPWKRILACWGGGLFFAALIAVPAIFTSGWNIALLLVARSETSLTCWLLVVMTTPFNRVLRALRALHMPLVFVAILGMTFRYIFLLVEAAQDMLLSRRSRIVGRLSGASRRRLLISTSGVLLSRSIQMGDDVHHAMTSRGFRGDIYLLDEFKVRPMDWTVLLLVGTISVLTLMVGR